MDWYPWSEEALRKSKSEDKPIFLSIGYAACHWCHVMEAESFENDEIAAILNEHFVSIKVDREQRPDLDQIYMTAAVALTGSGGWPMSIFLTPDLKPFFAGTYFPPVDKYGRPGFKRLLTEIARAYKTDRHRVERAAASLVEAMQRQGRSSGDASPPDGSMVIAAAAAVLNGYDSKYGGFGAAPKFPHATELSFLLKVYAYSADRTILDAVEHTLQSMARGGIYDQLGGGFHRYSTDDRWLVPHFEKMLYDNALLAVTYSEAFQCTGNELYRKVARETLDFMIREFRHNEGGFFSSLDADSEGEEGKYYVWRKSDVDRLLGPESDMFCSHFNITDAGNFEGGTNILSISSHPSDHRAIAAPGNREAYQLIDIQRHTLLETRSNRIRPFTDDKILTSWNGLAISGLSAGYQITRDSRYHEAALGAARFIKDKLCKNGRLLHSFRMGKVSDGLFLEDYAYLTQGLIALYEISYDFEWIILASQLADDAVDHFADDDGNLFLAPAGRVDHIMRPKDVADGALPAPGSILIKSMLMLNSITGDDTLRQHAEKALSAVSKDMARMPLGMTSALSAFSFYNSERIQVVLVGDDNRDPFLDQMYGIYLPDRVLVISDKGEEPIPLLEGRKAHDRTAAYVCRNRTCELPAETPEDLRRQLKKMTAARR